MPYLAQFLEQSEVLHVAGAHLDDVGVTGGHLDVLNVVAWGWNSRAASLYGFIMRVTVCTPGSTAKASVGALPVSLPSMATTVFSVPTFSWTSKPMEYGRSATWSTSALEAPLDISTIIFDLLPLPLSALQEKR